MSDHDEVPRTPPPPFDDPTTARAGSAPPPETSASPQQLGDYTIVHVGFAITRLDEESALETLKLFEEVGLLDEELNAGQHGAAGSAPVAG